MPCCLDHEGDLALGNLFESTLDEILSGERARRIYDGFFPAATRRRSCAAAAAMHVDSHNVGNYNVVYIIK